MLELGTVRLACVYKTCVPDLQTTFGAGIELRRPTLWDKRGNRCMLETANRRGKIISGSDTLIFHANDQIRTPLNRPEFDRNLDKNVLMYRSEPGRTKFGTASPLPQLILLCAKDRPF